MTLPRPPVEIGWITDLIGPDGALELIEAAGGTCVYVPREPSAGSPLTKMVGIERARALAAEYGGEEIRVPLCKVWRAWCYRAQGYSLAAIAVKLNCLDNTVRRMLRARPDDLQMVLPLPSPHRTMG